MQCARVERDVECVITLKFRLFKRARCPISAYVCVCVCLPFFSYIYLHRCARVWFTCVCVCLNCRLPVHVNKYAPRAARHSVNTHSRRAQHGKNGFSRFIVPRRSRAASESGVGTHLHTNLHTKCEISLNACATGILWVKIKFLFKGTDRKWICHFLIWYNLYKETLKYI